MLVAQLHFEEMY